MSDNFRLDIIFKGVWFGLCFSMGIWSYEAFVVGDDVCSK
jgi:hypothetical protein